MKKKKHCYCLKTLPAKFNSLNKKSYSAAEYEDYLRRVFFDIGQPPDPLKHGFLLP